MSTVRFDRRTMLKGLGAATGLASSFFGSAVARGQTASAPPRVLLVALQHGWGIDPDFGRVFSGTETNFVIPEPLTGFEAIRDRCVFVDGLRGTMWGNAHDVSYSDMFTASVPWEENGSAQLGVHFPEPMGPSIDHVIGQYHNKPVLRVSAGYGSWGRQSHPLCFNEQARELASFTSPRDAYDAIIAPIRDAAVPPPAGRQAVRDNLFAFLGRDTDRLLQRVSGTERTKLEGYLESFNALGDRILNEPNVDIAPSEIPGRPPEYNPFGIEVDHYLEMIRLVFRADTHRVAVLGLGHHVEDWAWTDRNGSQRSGNIWGSDFHQEVAHHSSNQDPRLAFEGWVEWYVQKIVQFAQSLANTPDVDGRSVLDNTVIVLTGEVGTGNHDRHDKLHTLIGGAGGLRGGRWISTPKVDPNVDNGRFTAGETRSGQVITDRMDAGQPPSLHHTADILVSIGRLAGVPLNSFGLGANNWSPIELT